MTRIFDALKKTETARAHAGHATASVTPLPAPTPAHSASARPSSAASSRPAADSWRVPLPVVGGVEITEDIVRAMTTLRMSLEASLGDRSTRTVLFAGPQGGEGASTVALQFAQTLARDEAIRPLLVDANARRPAYTMDAAHRAAVLDPRLQPRGAASVVTPNLFVLATTEDERRMGVVQPSLLRQVIDSTGAGFDWVILDGAAVMESPDTAPLAGLVDATVIVVRAGRTKRPVLVRAADLLRQAGARVMGSVLNHRVHEIPEFIYRRI